MMPCIQNRAVVSSGMRCAFKKRVSYNGQRKQNISSLSAPEAGKKAYKMRQSQKQSDKGYSLDTMLAHAGIETDHSRFNSPLSPALHMSTTYERPPSGEYPSDGFIYARESNPTRKLLEMEVYRLETKGLCKDTIGGTTTAYASGMAAVNAILMACPGAHVILPDDCYHGVSSQLVTILNQHGIQHTMVDMTHIDMIESTIQNLASQNTKIIVWMETPSNPLAKVTDIELVCRLVQHQETQLGVKLVTIVDSTWAPPLITLPLKLGADMVMHSATKYFGGHSDLTLGIVTTSPTTQHGRELGPKLREIQTKIGAVASPFDSWLCLRGLRTLSVRLRQQCKTAMELATFLNDHAFVTKVHYPGLPLHPQHDVACKQMTQFGGMLSFELQDAATAFAVVGGLDLIKRATSLGGTETLIEHRASIEPPDRVTSPTGLLRLSVGLEECTDLKEDLAIALHIAQEISAH